MNSAAIYPGMGIADFTSWFSIAAWPDLYTQTTFFNGFLQDSNLWDPKIPNDPSSNPFPSMTLTLAQTQQLETIALNRIPNLYALNSAENVLITGSSKKPSSPVGDELEESIFSDISPDLWAIGEGKFSFANWLEGTSYSAPQVAGLASYMWLLSPDLRSRPSIDTRQAILANTRDAGGVFRQLDAYLHTISGQGSLANTL